MAKLSTLPPPKRRYYNILPLSKLAVCLICNLHSISRQFCTLQNTRFALYVNTDYSFLFSSHNNNVPEFSSTV